MHKALRLASIVGSNNNKVFCNCGDASGPGSYGAMECCQVIDLGIVYEREPDLSGVCGQCEVYNPDTGYSNTTEAPHGRITDWRRACARLIVLTQVDLSGGTLGYSDRFIYYSRQPEQLPDPSFDFCKGAPLVCPAENGLYQCCQTTYKFNDKTTTRAKSRICSDNCDDEPDCTNYQKGLHMYSVSPCQLNTGGFMVGYAYAPDDWWFLDTGEFGRITTDILENDPYYSFKHTVYIYLALKSKYIYCCNWECNNCTTPSENYHQGRCGTSNFLGIRDKEERERSVQIYAAVGFAANSCGYTPESVCSLATI